ncbi:ABC transporter ATP-binding protein [Dialister micraerophilus]|uniref:ABC transporter, ATP-binding protein n=1 Tax=Dialister micraerophilus UPII 345-E TaxID=910314 RepID=E4L8J7_9FIRM|nr:ABC transporter ATP-binding protein [Dialister micraerophilus]EFR42956.1 ABC transporter, ATP-binding protein [Dialister micraerophilus UPII 345-E]
MITINHVNLTINERKILNDINLEIKKGETLVILGASGSGKSTVLKLMTGLIKPCSGSIFIKGVKADSLNEFEWNKLRKFMGMVFQYSALFDSMTVKENVAFGLRQHTKLKEQEIERIVKEKLNMVGLEGTEELYPSELSGGMKKRVSLARAVAMEPEIILYDEPTSGLDPIRSTDISLVIKNTQKIMKTTSVVVTHDLKSAEMIADRVAFLYKGTFIKIGTMKELMQSDDSRVRQFMHGLPSANVNSMFEESKI